MDGLA